MTENKNQELYHMYTLQIYFQNDCVVLVEIGRNQEEARTKMLQKKFSEVSLGFSRVPLERALIQGKIKDEDGDDGFFDYTTEMQIWNGTYRTEKSPFFPPEKVRNYKSVSEFYEAIEQGILEKVNDTLYFSSSSEE